MDDFVLMLYCTDFINNLEGREDLQKIMLASMVEDPSADNILAILDSYAGTVMASYIRSLSQEVVAEMMKNEVHVNKNWSNN